MLAEQIASLRMKAGMTQRELAQKLHIGPSAIGMYEQGRREPSVETLIQIADIFGVSLDYLMVGREAYTSFTNCQYGAVRPLCPCRICCEHFKSPESVCMD